LTSTAVGPDEAAPIGPAGPAAIEPASEPMAEPVIEPAIAPPAPIVGVPMMEAMRPAELAEGRPAGSRLEIIVHRFGRIVATLDGEEPEDVILEDIRQAAGALARSGGSATVSRADADETTLTLAEQVVAVLRASGVPTEAATD
jgi:hypothetical protein